MQAVDHGRHEATAHRRRRFILAEWDTILGIVATVAIVVVCVGVVLVRGDRPAAAAEPLSSCRRSEAAAWALISGGVQYKDVHGSIDNRVLSDPQLRRLYDAAQREHLACRDEVARQATGPGG
ncbi:MAG TPA: hypothetical protein VG276_28830 [Actinomycetes bacterium]|nr:hypothetical protein [Actinomycetes bacterium]